MTVVIRPERNVAITLSSMVMMLAGLLVWEWDQGLQLQQELTSMRSMPITEVPAQKILPEFTLPDAVTGFPDLLTRPLFSANRRAAVIPGKGGVIAMKKGQFVLVGVLITPRQRSALLRDAQTKKSETVVLAGVVRGITLAEVEPTRVVLRQGADSEELTLNVLAGPKLPSAPRQLQALPVAPIAAPAVAPPASAASASAASSPASSPAVAAKPIEGASAPKPPSTMPQPPPKK